MFYLFNSKIGDEKIIFVDKAGQELLEWLDANDMFADDVEFEEIEVKSFG